MYQISVIKTGGKRILLEDEHRVDRLLKFLPAGPITDPETGEQTGERSHALVQFIARQGGRRTVRCSDLALL